MTWHPEAAASRVAVRNAAIVTGPLVTPRLVIRRFDAGDGEGLFDYLSLPEAVHFEPYGVRSLEESHLMAAERAASPDFWAVCLADSGRLVGNLYLHRSDPAEWLSFELGYVFHPDHWGNGYASEAASTLLNACFEQTGAHRVWAECNPDNFASWRLLERLGFRREGHLLANASFADDADGNPIWQDTYLYGLLATEWSGPS